MQNDGETMEITKAELNDLNEIFEIESECFPKEQAASFARIKERLETYPDHFWLLKKDGIIISYVNGMCTDKKDLSDEMYSDVHMHDENGDWQMLFGVCTRKQYRNKGYASKVIQACIEESKQKGRKGIVLTCLENRIPFYERCGFVNEGISSSVHGDVTWFQMRIRLDQ